MYKLVNRITGEINHMVEFKTPRKAKQYMRAKRLKNDLWEVIWKETK